MSHFILVMEKAKKRNLDFLIIRLSGYKAYVSFFLILKIKKKI